MKTYAISSSKDRRHEKVVIYVIFFILSFSTAVANAQDVPTGYLTRRLGGFRLSEAPPPKRPTKPLPPLPLVYNPQPGRSGHAAKPITQTAAQPEFRASSETQFLSPAVSGGGNQMAPIAPIMPQQSMLNPQTLIHMFKGADGNTTIVPLNSGPSLYQLPAFPIRGSKAEYIRK